MSGTLSRMVARVGPAILLLGFFALRGFNPLADAPYFLDWSGGLYFDEGAYTHNARNKLLFGEWRLDQWNNLLYSPLHNLLVYLSFSLFGIGFLQERLIPLALSCLGLLLFGLTLRRAFGGPTALLGTVLLGTNYLAIMFGRLGLLEIPVTFAAILALYCFARGLDGRRPAWFFLMGVSSFLVYVFKNLHVYLVAAAFLSVLYESVRRSGARRWRDLVAFLGGMGAAMVPWLLLFYLPNRETIASIGGQWVAQSLPASLEQLTTNIVTQPFFVALARVLVVVLLGCAGLGLVLYLVARRPERLHGVEVLAGLWLLGGAAFLALLSYRPARYYVPLIPALCLLAARLVVRALGPDAIGRQVRRDPWVYLLVALGALVIAFSGVFPYLRWGASLGARFLLALPVAAGAVGLALVLFCPWREREVRLRAVGWGLLVLVAFGVGLDLYQYWRWTRRPVYGMVTISQELGRLPGRAVIAGLATPALVLENPHRAIYAGREGWFDGVPDLFQRYPEISHLLLATYNGELDWYYRTFPDVMARARLLKIYQVWKTHLFLYSLREGESPRLVHPPGKAAGYDAVVHGARFPFAVRPGETFQVTLAVRNAGAEPWRASDGVALGARDDEDAFAARRHPLTGLAVAEPGALVTFLLPMRAPARPGLYVSDWQMVKEGAFWFGEPYLGVIWVREQP